MKSLLQAWQGKGKKLVNFLSEGILCVEMSVELFLQLLFLLFGIGAQNILLIFSQFQVEKLTLPKVGKAPSFALVTACPG